MYRRTALGAAVASLLAAPSLRAQDRFPSRAVRVVVPFAPGGPTDVFARRFVDRFQRALGQTVVIENKAGAGGMLGAQDVARSRPDGYSLIFHASSSALTSPLVYRRPLYDPVKDFEQVSLLGVVPFVLAVGPQTGATNTAELVAALRARPGALSYGSSGVGTSNHLSAALFLARAGDLRAEHIPYRGSGPAIQDLVAGTTAFQVDTFGTLYELHRDRRLRIIAVMHPTRSVVDRGIPTLAEQGITGAEASTFNILAAPAGTPPEAMAALSDATRRVMADSAFQEELLSIGIEPEPDTSPRRALTFLAGELEKWRVVVQAAGVSIE
ncbi:tripartite tricarboxylate transporter substrate binding protein [Roseomonas terrae]|uniref:Tripartite tricarboxylate transporter substrate binding protein n=1 Tax=Neoroseomonas terrae TaxID=424799 RepID=A0ABS5EK73_9PROT|nr:tripartite tricarboxylate transporter substrate-binding protein [Neoroseomonas terrae]MBR0651429.1 tripartite tricarboxylate transporter substrate binding protein [Neoroseomonas terrae]